MKPLNPTRTQRLLVLALFAILGLNMQWMQRPANYSTSLSLVSDGSIDNDQFQRYDETTYNSSCEDVNNKTICRMKVNNVNWSCVMSNKVGKLSGVQVGTTVSDNTEKHLVTGQCFKGYYDTSKLAEGKISCSGSCPSFTRVAEEIRDQEALFDLAKGLVIDQAIKQSQSGIYSGGMARNAEERIQALEEQKRRQADIENCVVKSTGERYEDTAADRSALRSCERERDRKRRQEDQQIAREQREEDERIAREEAAELKSQISQDMSLLRQDRNNPTAQYGTYRDLILPNLQSLALSGTSYGRQAASSSIQQIGRQFGYNQLIGQSLNVAQMVMSSPNIDGALINMGMQGLNNPYLLTEIQSWQNLIKGNAANTALATSNLTTLDLQQAGLLPYNQLFNARTSRQGSTQTIDSFSPAAQVNSMPMNTMDPMYQQPQNPMYQQQQFINPNQQQFINPQLTGQQLSMSVPSFRNNSSMIPVNPAARIQPQL